MIIVTGPDGHELGDKDACGAIASCSGETFNAYSRQRKPYGNPAPLPVSVDIKTKRKLWRLIDVHAWNARRPGSGRRVLDTDSRTPNTSTGDQDPCLDPSA